MFGIKSIGKAVSSVGDTLSKFNQTLHGNADAAAKTTEYVKSGASGIMTAKDVKDCVFHIIPVAICPGVASYCLSGIK